MSYKVKLMILKEVKEITNFKSYYQTLILYVFLAGGLSGIICYGFTSIDADLLRGAMAVNLIFLPVFLMFISIMPFIKEKFNDEKIMNHFEAILATPVNLTEIWISKIISIFLLSYPIVIITVVLFTFICSIITKINPLSFSPVLWLVTLFVAPVLPMMYVALSSWSILRFTRPRLLEILNLVVIGLAILFSLSAGQVAMSPINGNFLNSITIISIIGISITGISIFFIIIWFMVRSISKEKITI